MNLVLGSGEQRIHLLPYQVKALASGLGAALPSLVTSELSVVTPDETHVMLGAGESLSGHQVVGYDDLSVSVTWSASEGELETPLVRGMAYVTGLYRGLTPALRVPSAAVLGVNGGAVSPVTAERLTVELNNGQTWNVYASESLSWSWSSSEIRADRALEGWVRVALVPDAEGASVLDQHAAAIPTGGIVDLSRNGATGSVRFGWRRTGEGELLMLALPHQLPLLRAPNARNLSYATIRGRMSALAGDEWSLEYPLSTISWTAPRPVDSALLPELRAALLRDADYMPLAADPYFGGKQLAKLARLMSIARELGEDDLVSAYLDRLEAQLDAWLGASNENRLVYDTTWGGVVSAAGIQDSGADFGQGYYNDHHFHYGYFVYAAALLGRERPDWLRSRADQVLWLIRDIANPSSADPYFPRFRAFDWFEGHSWAAGLFEFGDNRNQESTSEAVNAWYGVELFGQALGDPSTTHVGGILRAAEAASARTYWQISDASQIYAAPFKANHAVGVLWATKVDFATFFGANAEYVYGIQMLPFTPASEDLLDPAWVRDAWPDFAAAAETASAGWQGFLYMARAVLDPTAAAEQARSLAGYDDGNSEANTLYWIGTRPR